MELLGLFIISVLSAAGMAIVFVEKRYEWPVRKANLTLKRRLRKIDKRLGKLAECSICLSFWTCLFVDLVVMVLGLISGYFYFLWPISGFAASGLVWVIYQLLEVLESKSSLEAE
jgi:hypothetical protein